MRRSELAPFAVMIAMSGLAVAAGEPVGYLGLVFFGGGGAVYWYLQREPRAPVEWPRHGTLHGAERHTAHPAGIVFARDRTAMVAAAAGSAIFVATGAGLVGMARASPTGGGTGLAIVGIVTVAVFGAFLIFALIGAVRPGGVALLREGVYCRLPTGTAWLPWESLAAVSVASRYGQPFVGLLARLPEEVRLTGANRLLQGWQRRRYHMDFGYSAGGGRRRNADLRDAVAHYQEDAGARARLTDPDEAHRW